MCEPGTGQENKDSPRFAGDSPHVCPWNIKIRLGLSAKPGNVPTNQVIQVTVFPSERVAVIAMLPPDGRRSGMLMPVVDFGPHVPPTIQWVPMDYSLYFLGISMSQVLHCYTLDPD